ncbi:FecR family protein [Corticibacterium sp. UT-5YL-CI-8]|nr:FecR family protein [Tianweitania sp. UT-5YL-CI-8]
MKRTDDETPDLLEEAMDWFLRLRSVPAGSDVAEDFACWLNASKAHSQAWEKANQTWQVMGEVQPEYEHLWRPGFIAPRRRGRRLLWGAGIGAALVAGLFLFLAMPSLVLRLRADHLTQTAELQTITLEDGSTIELGAASAIATSFTAFGRHVTLLAGEAFFDVRSDAARPFTVEAGGVEVSVIGTAFDVSLSETQTTVQLARGVVALSSESKPGKSLELAPGEMATVSHADGMTVRSTIAQEDIASWRSGRLFVSDVSIGEVAEALQRYHAAWISIPDGSLAAQRVTGLYDLKNPDRALGALVEPYGGKVHRISPYLRVLAPF